MVWQNLEMQWHGVVGDRMVMLRLKERHCDGDIIAVVASTRKGMQK